MLSSMLQQIILSVVVKLVTLSPFYGQTLSFQSMGLFPSAASSSYYFYTTTYCHILCCRKSYPVLHRVLHPSIDLTTIVDKLFTHFYTWTNILFAATSMQSKVSRQLTHRVYKYTTYESKQLFSTLYIISLISSFSNFLTFSQVFQADRTSSHAISLKSLTKHENQVNYRKSL